MVAESADPPRRWRTWGRQRRRSCRTCGEANTFVMCTPPRNASRRATSTSSRRRASDETSSSRIELAPVPVRPAPSTRRSDRRPTRSCRRSRRESNRYGDVRRVEVERAARASPSWSGRASGGAPPTARSTPRRSRSAVSSGRDPAGRPVVEGDAEVASTVGERGADGALGRSEPPDEVVLRRRPEGPEAAARRSLQYAGLRRRVGVECLAEPAGHRGPQRPRDAPGPGVVPAHDVGRRP